MYKANRVVSLLLWLPVFFLQILCMMPEVQSAPARSFRTLLMAKQFLCSSWFWQWNLCLCSESASPPRCESLFFIPCARPLPRCLRTVGNPAEPIRWNAAGSRSLRLIDIRAWPLSVCSPPENLIQRRTLSKRLKVTRVIAQTTLLSFSFQLLDARRCVTLSQITI